MKGKQNFIVEGVTVILIITCDTKKGKKAEGKETNSGVKTTSGIYISARSFVIRARTALRTCGESSWRASPCTVELL